MVFYYCYIIIIHIYNTQLLVVFANKISNNMYQKYHTTYYFQLCCSYFTIIHNI